MSSGVVPVGGHVPEVGPRAWVAPGAFLLGKVVLAEGASVWYTAVLRGDIEEIRVGADSNLQDGVVVHTDDGFPVSVGDRVSVGHRAVLHGCTIEDDVLVGMGAVVLNGARIGSGSLVAAGAVVLQDAVVPPGSLVAGVPAKVRRSTTDEEREAISHNAALYAQLRDRHAGGAPGPALD